MAEPTGFKEANKVFGPPPGVSEEQVGSINACVTGDNQVVTCWRLSAEELEEVNRTGRIWLGVHGGLPPHWISGHYPFTSTPADD